MITIDGTLRVKRIRNARNGAFCIADLLTECGEFKVKDPLLDQFDEGDYHGRFWITEIHLAQYVAYGKGVTEIRARLHDLQVDREQRGSVPREPSEVDPLEERPSPRIGSQGKARPDKASPSRSKPGAGHALAGLKSNSLARRPDDAQPNAQGEPAASVPDDQPQATPAEVQGKPAPAASALVGGSTILDAEAQASVESGQPVKLDPTVDRALLRQQGDLLRRNGFRFNAKSQTWMPPEN